MGLDYNSIDQDPQLLRMEAAPQVRIQLRKYADGRIKSSGVFARQQFEASREASRSATSGAPPKRAGVPSLKDLEVSSDTDDSIIGASHTDVKGHPAQCACEIANAVVTTIQASSSELHCCCSLVWGSRACSFSRACRRSDENRAGNHWQTCHSTHASRYSLCLTAA
jgi:hypothetical protein